MSSPCMLRRGPNVKCIRLTARAHTRPWPSLLIYNVTQSLLILLELND